MLANNDADDGRLISIALRSLSTRSVAPLRWASANNTGDANEKAAASPANVAVERQRHYFRVFELAAARNEAALAPPPVAAFVFRLQRRHLLAGADEPLNVSVTTDARPAVPNGNASAAILEVVILSIRHSP